MINNLIFLPAITGEPGLKTFETQLVSTLENLRTTLKQDGSSLHNLVRLSIWLRDIRHSRLFWTILSEYLREHAPGLLSGPPAVTVNEASSFVEPGCLVEIDSIAVLTKVLPGWEVRKNPLVIAGVKQAFPYTSPGEPFLSESVTVGNLVFVSAMNGANPETGKVETSNFEEQWRTALGRVDKAMVNAGSSLNNIIKTLHFQTGVADIMKPSKYVSRSYSPASDRLWKSELEYYAERAPLLLEEFPASTFLKVSALPDPLSLGQTEVTGAISRFVPYHEVKSYPLYLGKRGFPRHIGETQKYYSNAVKAGDLVFISGQTATDPETGRVETEDFSEQMLMALKNLKTTVEETGGSLENLIKTYLLIPSPGNLREALNIQADFYRKYAPKLLDSPPARTIIHPLALAGPRLLIEIEAFLKL